MIIRERRLKHPGDGPLPQRLKRVISGQLAITRGPLARTMRRAPIAQITPAGDHDRMPEAQTPPVGAVLGQFDLDQVLGRTVGAAAHGAALGAQGRKLVGVVRAAVVDVLGAVLEALKAGRGAGLGDVAQGAFADVHELPVAPVRAHGEVRPVVLARVEEDAHRTGRQVWVREGRAHYPHQQLALVDVVPGLVGPAVPSPATGEGLEGDAVAGAEPVGAKCELHEGEVQHAGVGDAVAWRGEKGVAGVGAVVERVNDRCGLESFAALLRAAVVSAARHAEEMMR